MTTLSRARRRVLSSFVCVAALLLVSGFRLFSQSNVGGVPTVIVNGREAVAGEVLVKFAADPGPAGRAQLEAQLDAVPSDPMGPNTRRVRSQSYDVETMVAYLRTRPDVVYAEPNYMLYAHVTPNDAMMSGLWGLLNVGQTISGKVGTADADIDATDAWDLTTGSVANVVGVVDTGVDYNHPDLAANIWSAPTSFTVTINGVLVTCPAGSHGYNAITRSCNPFDDNGHGTHVSGTIGAVGNNGTGVAGVNWTASIMGLKFLAANGSGSTANAVNLIEFAVQTRNYFAGTQGANVRVLSNSWGGGGYSQTLLDAINKANANGMLFVASAGNSNSNNVTTPAYPASYNAPNIISVAATDNKDLRASFSNYGANVHLAAPGVSTLSTTPGNTYSYYSGTSMAAPHVSGVAALMLSKCAMTTATLKASILSTVDIIPALTGIVSTSGRLNANKALGTCTPSVPAAPTNVKATGGTGQVTVTWNAVGGATSYTVKRSTVPGAEVAVATGLAGTSFVDTGRTNGTTYFYVVSATNAFGEGANSAEVSAKPVAPPTLAAAGGPNSKQVTLAWSASTGATSYTVKQATSSGGPYTTRGTVSGTSYVDTGLKSKKRYYYVVTAANSTATSVNSNEATAIAK